MWKTAADRAAPAPPPVVTVGVAGSLPGLSNPVPSRVQLGWLRRGLGAPGGKLPIFDRSGREVPRRVIVCCVKAGWAAPWFSNPLKPDWLVCRITDKGRDVVERFVRAR